MADIDSNLSDDYPHIPNSLELLRIKYAAKDDQNNPESSGSDLGLVKREKTQSDRSDLDHDEFDEDEFDEDEFEGSLRRDSGTVSHTGSILIEAAEKGDVGTVKNVLGNPSVNPDSKTKYQARSALHLACGYGQYDVAEKLLQAGADPMQFSYAGRTPLHEACQGGHPKILGLLLDYTREVDSQDRDGQTPAHIAAMNGEVNCLKVLHDREASLVVEDKTGRQPAHLAAVRNHRKVIEFLYDVGVDLECTDELGKLPVHHAAHHGALSCLVCLIERDSDITIGDNVGNLPMHYAAWHDQLDCMRFLVKQGSLIDFTNTERKTAVHIAAHHGGVHVLHWLLEKGADPNAVDVHGNTAAHYACQGGKAECFHCLLHHNMNMYIKNLKGAEPMAWAKKYGHSLLIEKAMKSEVPCPSCKKQQDYDKWKDRFKPSPVLMSVSELKEQAYTCPVPKLQRVPTQVQTNSERRVRKLNKSPGAGAGAKSSATKAQGARSPGAEAKASTPGLAARQTQKTRKHLPNRDLPTKYFGEYLEINDLYKFKA